MANVMLNATNTPPWQLYKSIWTNELENYSIHYEEPSPYLNCSQCGSPHFVFAQARINYYTPTQSEGSITLSDSGVWEVATYLTPVPSMLCLSCDHTFPYPQDRYVSYDDTNVFQGHTNVKAKKDLKDLLGISEEPEPDMPIEYDDDEYPEPEELS